MLQNTLKNTSNSKQYDIKLIDFSAASWFTDPDLNFNTKVKYAPAMSYRPPEAFLGLKKTPLTDIWSAGCTLFELFAGFPLFKGGI